MPIGAGIRASISPCQAQRGVEPRRQPRVGPGAVLPELEHRVFHQASDRLDPPPGVVLGERLTLWQVTGVACAAVAVAMIVGAV